MKKHILNALVFVLFVFCITLFFVFRTSSSSGLWKSYVVLIAPVSVSPELVLSELNKIGVTSIVNYTKPSVSFESAVEQLQSDTSSASFFPYDPFFPSDARSFFTDKDNSSMLYYIPREFESHIRNAQKNKAVSFEFSLDTEQKMPNTSFFSCLAVSLFLLLISKNKRLFLSLSSPSVMFSLCFPALSILPLLLCLLYTVYFVQQKYGRKSILLSFKSNTILIILIGFMLLLLFFIPRTLIIFVCILFLSTAAGYWWMHALLTYIEGRKRFVPVLIFSALYTHKKSKKSVFLFLPAALSLILCVVFVLLYSEFSLSSRRSLVLPSPEKSSSQTDFSLESYIWCLENSDSMATLAHYVSDCWNRLVFPYTRPIKSEYSMKIPLHSTAGITRFTREGTLIKSYYETLFTFDNTFIDSILNGIKTSTGGIQKVLMGQHTFTPVVYKPVTNSTDRNTWIMLLSISCIFFSLLILFSYTKFHSRKEHA